MLSERAKKLKTSPTLFLVAKAKELQAQGHAVISLTVGEPDWETFPDAAQAGIQAIQNGITKYTAANGTLELRKNIADRIKKDINLSYNPQQVVVTSGAKFAIFSALQVLCNPGDEVIIHSPYWVSYPTMVELADAVPKIVTCTESTNFKITAELLQENITEKTKILLFCSPSNPTGFVYSANELKKIGEVLAKYPQIIIISDDMYNRLMFDGTLCAPHILQSCPELKERTLIINGASKAYSMTGWRIGWALGNSQIIKAIGDYASQSTGAPSSIAQSAAAVALVQCEKNIVETNLTLIKRMNFAYDELRSIESFTVYKPQGAFYFWINVQQALGKKIENVIIDSSKKFCEVLLDKYFVSTVPGEEFGNPGFMRISFAINESSMFEAIQRMKLMLSQMTTI